MIFLRALALACCLAVLAAAVPAAAKDRTASIVIRAGKTGSPSHVLARQFAEAVAVAVNGAYTLDVQESQGSVQNVIDAAAAPRNFVFTSGPDVIAAAQAGRKPFKPDRRYREIRALFPMPAQTLQWVVRQDSGMTQFDNLAGHSFIAGTKGSVSERLTTAMLQLLGIDRTVQLMAIDTTAAPAALKTSQVGGFAIAGAYPVPAILDLAHALPIRLLTSPPRQLMGIVTSDDSTAIEIVPKGTYPGMAAGITTLALPDGVYTTRRMRAATAYRITKAFWTQHDALAKRDPPWAAVSFFTLATLKVRLHAGALRYYRERGVAVPQALR